MSKRPLHTTGSDSTQVHASMPWSEQGRLGKREALHLVILWYGRELSRVGDSAALTRNSMFGRGVGEGQGLPRLEFARQRPGSLVPAQALTAPTLSRNQLEFEVTQRGVNVKNVGRCELWHNGLPCSEAELCAGDTISLRDTVVFLVERRHLLWAEMPDLRQHSFAFGEPDPFGIVGESECAWRLREQLAAAARGKTHVLITGATGTGKELSARAIHRLSGRAHGPFVSRSAATFPETLIDAELFGNAKNYPNVGAPERKGLIGEADGGYLFLDEVGELPVAQQAHLLRVLDRDGEYQRLGDSQARSSSMCVIAATNRDVGELKHDFAARFPGRVHVSSLSERISDLPWLIRHLFGVIAEQDPTLRARFDAMDDTVAGAFMPVCEPRLLEVLARHEFAGNTRELERLLRLGLATSRQRYVGLTLELEAELSAPEPRTEPAELDGDTVKAALEAAAGSPTEAAKRLGLRNRHVFYRLMKKHGL